MKITDALLPEFDQEMANTRKTLERIPDGKFAWKPHPKSFGMGSLATHIANMVGWTPDTIAKDSFDVAPPGAPPYKEEPATSNKELLDKFDEVMTESWGCEHLGHHVAMSGSVTSRAGVCQKYQRKP